MSHLFNLLGRLNQAPLMQVIHNLPHTLLHALLIRPNRHLRSVRSLIRRTNTRELLDLAGSSLLVQSLGIPLLSDLNRHLDVYLDELNLALLVLLVQLPRHLAILLVRADETRQGDGRGVGEELGHLGDTADVLVAVGFGEAQVLVQAETDVVAVEAVGGETQVQEVLFQGGSNRGFARCGKAREPDGKPALGAQAEALGAREGGVPGYVAVRACQYGVATRGEAMMTSPVFGGVAGSK